MKNKLENLIVFDDFKASWKAEQAKKTKRTDTGLDILKEGVEEIIPEGIPEETNASMKPKFGTNEEKIEEIKSFVDDTDDDVIDDIIEQLRDVLLEMEQQGLIEKTTTDDLDDKHDGDWIAWIKDVIELPEFPEEGLNNLVQFINDISDDLEFRSRNDDEDEDVECPDCDGTGQDDDGEDCERCDGTGRVYRPDDIPPDDFSEDDIEDDIELEESIKNSFNQNEMNHDKSGYYAPVKNTDKGTFTIMTKEALKRMKSKGEIASYKNCGYHIRYESEKELAKLKSKYKKGEKYNGEEITDVQCHDYDFGNF